MGSRRNDLPAHRAPRSRSRPDAPPKPLIDNSTKATPREEEHPPPALRPRQEVQRVNQRCIEGLTQAARVARAEMSPLVTELREVLLQMTPETRARAARRTFLLVDMELGNTDLWRRFKGHRARVEFARARGTFPRAAAIQLARAILILAWYGIRTDRYGATLLLGMSAAVSDIITGLSLADIDRIAEGQFCYVRPRWEDRPDLWLKLLSASRTPDIRRAREINLRGLQLIVGAVVIPTSVRAGGSLEATTMPTIRG
jgi:hypothetical protein